MQVDVHFTVPVEVGHIADKLTSEAMKTLEAVIAGGADVPSISDAVISEVRDRVQIQIASIAQRVSDMIDAEIRRQVFLEVNAHEVHKEVRKALRGACRAAVKEAIQEDEFAADVAKNGAQ